MLRFSNNLIDLHVQSRQSVFKHSSAGAQDLSVIDRGKSAMPIKVIDKMNFSFCSYTDRHLTDSSFSS